MRSSDDPNCKCDFSGAEIGWCRYCMEKVWRGQQRRLEKIKRVDPELYEKLGKPSMWMGAEQESLVVGQAVQAALQATE